MCACMCLYVCVLLRIDVLFRLCGLSQNIKFHGHMIPEPLMTMPMLISVITEKFAYRDVI